MFNVAEVKETCQGNHDYGYTGGKGDMKEGKGGGSICIEEGGQTS